MIAFRVLTMDEAIRSVNHETLILLFGMMIVVANLRLSGFFAMVSAWVVEHTHHPLALLAAIVLVSGVFSAFFVNDTMCLVLTPSRAGHRNAAPTKPDTLPAGGRHGRQHRQRRHDHGKSPEHDDRDILADPLPDLFRGDCADFGGRIDPHGRADRSDVPPGICRRTPYRHRKAARPGEYRVVVEVRGGGRRDDYPVFHGIARHQGRGSDGRDPAHHAPRQTGKGLPGDRLVPAGTVCSDCSWSSPASKRPCSRGIS